MWWWLIGALWAAEPVEAQPMWPVTLAAEVGGLAGPGAGGALATARVVVNLRALSFEVSAGEGYVAGIGRQAGHLGLGLRRYLWRGSYVRGGFAHAHEVPWDTFTSDPGASLAGTHTHILHRSGVELGFGWLVPLASERTRGRLAFTVDVAGKVYPGPAAPLGYAQVAVGLAGHLGRPRQPRAAHDPSPPPASQEPPPWPDDPV